MNYLNLHPWKVNIKEAVQIQQKLRKKIILSSKPLKISKIAGVDVGFSDSEAICAVCVFDFPELNLIEAVKAKRRITFPYVPGLLTFREGPAVVSAFSKLQNRSDLVLFDGQGICHPRRMGIAAHLGLVLDIPSIGCAKSHLYGAYQMPKDVKGSFSYIYPHPKACDVGIYDKGTKEIIGVVLRTRQQVKPLFVSCGHKISLEQAIKIVLELCPKYRIPQPLRYAHQLAQNAR
jgi:deoxyribonuclease V